MSKLRCHISISLDGFVAGTEPADYAGAGRSALPALGWVMYEKELGAAA